MQMTNEYHFFLLFLYLYVKIELNVIDLEIMPKINLQIVNGI